MSRPLRLVVLLALGLALLTTADLHYLAPKSRPHASAGPAPAVVAHDGPAFVSALEARPLLLSPLPVPKFTCPARPSPNGPIGVFILNTGSGAAVYLEVPASYAGAILVRGQRMRTAEPLGFSDLYGKGDAGLTGTVAFDGPFVSSPAAGFREMAVLHARLRSVPAQFPLATTGGPGCLALQLDGYDLLEVVYASVPPLAE